MSWPQWPGSGAVQPGLVSSLSTPVINPAPAIVNPATNVAPSLQYSQEQWAQMQQQNWQQWAQWQQQFQQWQQQYGAQYAKTLSALTTQQAPQQPNLPNTAVPPPLPVDPKPPLPPDEPPATSIAKSTPHPNANYTNMSGFNCPVNQPPPPYQNQRTDYGRSFNPSTFNQTNVGNFSKPPPNLNQNANNTRNDSSVNKVGHLEKQQKKSSQEMGSWNQQSNDSELKSSQKSNVEELSEAEKKFDKQFADWEAQFQRWKEQNANHPDKAQYREYEKKWETWRKQLLERREQMRRKRLGLLGDAKLPQNVDNLAQNAPGPKNPNESHVLSTQKELRPPLQKLSTPSNENAMQSKMISEKSESCQDNLKLYPTEESTSVPFLKSSSTDGIPGLDLVKDQQGEEKDENIKENNDANCPNLAAISKGLDSILGDKKFLNILNMVSMNQVVNASSSTSDSQALVREKEQLNNTYEEGSVNSLTDVDSNLRGTDNARDVPESFEKHLFNKNQESSNYNPNVKNVQPPFSGGNYFRSGINDKQDNYQQNYEEKTPFLNTEQHFNKTALRNENNFDKDSRNVFPNRFGPSGPENVAPQNLNRSFNNFGVSFGRSSDNYHFSSNAQFHEENNPENTFRSKNYAPFQRNSKPYIDNFDKVSLFNKNVRNSNPDNTNRFSNDPEISGNNFPNANRFRNDAEMSGNNFPNTNRFRNDPEISGNNFPNTNRFRNEPEISGNNFPRNFPINNIPERDHGNFSGMNKSNFNENQNFKGPNNFDPFPKRDFQSNPNIFDNKVNFEPPINNTPINEVAPFENIEEPVNKLPEEEIIWKPDVITDYDHKSLKQNEFEVIVEPVYTFDYRHKPLNRIPLPQRPNWLKQTVKNYPEFDFILTRSFEPQQLRRYPNESGRFQNFPDGPYGRSKYQDDFFDDKKGHKRSFNDKMTTKSEHFYDRKRKYDDFVEGRNFDDKLTSERNRNYDSESYDKSKMMDSNPYARRKPFDNYKHESKLSDDQKEMPVKKSSTKSLNPNFDKWSSSSNEFEEIEENATASSKANENSPFINKSSNVTLIEDLLNSPGRFNRPSRIVIILRGPPGSGKTTLAKLIKDKEVENGGSAPRILSLDDYFMIEHEKEVIEDGRKVKVKDMVYEYEECMEASYRQSLMKSFKKTITDGYFPFIIVDNVNDKVKYFGEMWSFAKQNGFQVYICQLELDVQTCTKRNVHGRTEAEIQKCVKGWEPTPAHHPKLDATSLIQSGSIPEVEMEEIDSPPSVTAHDEKEREFLQENAFRSKWDALEFSEDNLAKLDGIDKPLRPSKTMEDYLQFDEWDQNVPSKPGQKRVRWADLEERKKQEKMRAIGFVVGQTNWDRMMDPTMGSSALTQTKVFDRFNY